jgi:hypothetical protein
MKKRFVLISVLILVIMAISGCKGIKGEEAIKIAEERVEKEFSQAQEYDVRASKAVQEVGIWNIIVNVTLTERDVKIKGHYLVKVDKEGNVIDMELKKMGNFRN